MSSKSSIFAAETLKNTIMKIKATDIRVSEQGLLTHQPITICESGVLIKYQNAKLRDITLCVDGNMCVIKENGKTTHIITAPFKIKIDKGIE